MGVDGAAAIAEQSSAGDSLRHGRFADDKDIIGDSHIPEAAEFVERNFIFVDVAEPRPKNFVGDVKRIKPRL